MDKKVEVPELTLEERVAFLETASELRDSAEHARREANWNMLKGALVVLWVLMLLRAIRAGASE